MLRCRGSLGYNILVYYLSVPSVVYVVMLSHSQGYLVTEIFMWYLMSSMSIASTLSRLSTNHWLNLSNERRGLNTCC